MSDPLNPFGSLVLGMEHLTCDLWLRVMTICTSTFRPAAWIGALAAGVLLALASPAVAGATLTSVSTDPFTNDTSQHATEVEPDTFAHGSTVVATFQVGRFFNGGASDIGFARSGDGGATWSTSSFLPGLASNAEGFNPNSAFERVSDASVAYDDAHSTWLISSIPLEKDTLVVPTVFVSRSTTDDGVSFDDPVQIPPPATRKVDLDKNWTVCDNHPDSDFYGHCYTEFDNFGQNDLEYMSTSSDGGASWSTPVSPAGHPLGLGGQPVVQPDGTVIVPFESLRGTIAAFKSTDGGVSWSRETKISRISFHPNAGGLRTSPLPTAEIDSAGKVYVAWEDCRFEPGCSANDIVFSTSSDGTNWSAVQRVPIDEVGSGVDHFIPGIAVDPATSGSGAHVALTYYFYPDTTCAGGCQLEAGYISSRDGGSTWSDPTTLTESPMSLDDIAATSQGPMVGDYISTSINGTGGAATVIAVGHTKNGTTFNEDMESPGILPVSGGTAARSATASGAHRGRGVGAAQKAIRKG
jgi:hypothetical protein